MILDRDPVFLEKLELRALEGSRQGYDQVPGLWLKRPGVRQLMSIGIVDKTPTRLGRASIPWRTFPHGSSPPSFPASHHPPTLSPLQAKHQAHSVNPASAKEAAHTARRFSRESKLPKATPSIGKLQMKIVYRLWSRRRTFRAKVLPRLQVLLLDFRHVPSGLISLRLPPKTAAAHPARRHHRRTTHANPRRSETSVLS